MTYQAPKGTEDYYPEKKAVQNAIFDSLRTSAKSFGFNEVDTPVFETLNLLTAKQGEEIKSQIFTLEKRGSEELGLRFDLTVPYTRLFVQKQKELPKPVKWFGIANCWRYEAPQKGRTREFYQLSAELFGSDKAIADAEIINLSVDCLNRLGLRKDDFYVRLTNRKLLEGLLLGANVPKDKIEAAMRIIDKKLKISDEEFTKELVAEGLDKETADRIKEISNIKGSDAFVKIKQMKSNELVEEGLAELTKVFELLNKDYAEIDLSLARGLAYYTGTVFELADKTGKFRAIAGGGRYDNLVEIFGGEPTPAVGFAMGDKVLWLLLEAKGKLPKVEIGPEYYVVVVSPDVLPDAVKISAELSRKSTCDIDLMGRRLGKQIEYANAIGARKVVIVGPQELKEGKVKVKDMKSGKEIFIPIDKL